MTAITIKKWHRVVKVIGVLGLLFYLPIYLATLFIVGQVVKTISAGMLVTLFFAGTVPYALWLAIILRKGRATLSPADRLLLKRDRLLLKRAKQNRPPNLNLLRAGISIFVILIALGCVPSEDYWAYFFHRAPLVSGDQLGLMNPRAGRRYVTVDIGPSKSTGVMHWRFINHSSSKYLDGNYVLTTVDGHPLIVLVGMDVNFSLPPFEMTPRRIQGTFRLISEGQRAAVSTGGDSCAYGALQSKLDAAFKDFSPKPYPDFYLDTTEDTREFGAEYFLYGVPALLLGIWWTFVYFRQRKRFTLARH